MTISGRIAHAVRGLKFISSAITLAPACRIAHAVRGLKYRFPPLFEEVKSVASLTRCVD